LGLIVDQGPTVRVLALFTCRPDFASPWGGRSHLTQVTLSRLTRRQAADMVGRVARGKALPGEGVEQVVVRTDGVPLFVEELTKMVLESGLLKEQKGRYELTGPLPPLAIPATLQDSLMARLDRLAAVKEVAQLGATLGREFSYEVLQAVSPLDEATLQKGLSQLVEAELLYQRGLAPQATYVFKHALVQEAAYQSLLKSRRQQFHQRIAQVLEERFVEIKEAQPELLAHHYTEAGLIEQAIPCWQRAGERAAQRSAYLEAIHHFKKGLELLKTLPDGPEHTQRELDLQIALGEALIVTKGYAAPEVEHAYARARELCQQEEETPQAFLALLGLGAFYIVRADYQTARKLGEQVLGLARRLQDPALLVWAQHEMEVTVYYLGEFASAREHGEQGISLYDPQLRHSLFFYIADPGMACRVYASHTLWHLGYPDQALKRSHEALTLARDLSHPHSLAYALTGAAWVYQFRREPQGVQERTEELIALSTDQGFSFFLPLGVIPRGWVLVEQGQAEEGIAQMRQGLAAYRATGAELASTYLIALLAEGYGKGGQPEEGLRVLTEALTAVERTGERFYEAELYRLKGELLRQTADGRPTTADGRKADGRRSAVGGQRSIEEAESEAETCFHKAISVARHQQARSLELRATVSLCRLWQGQGKREEARQMLQEIYGWFTEGFDTVDLKEAKALLEALA
ncbi:MAG: hypothetical protein HY686_02040, partial [Chloroflexi bacterium]|nr:hypothetical protein [Chloroflexota bacterium]